MKRKAESVIISAVIIGTVLLGVIILGYMHVERMMREGFQGGEVSYVKNMLSDIGKRIFAQESISKRFELDYGILSIQKVGNIILRIYTDGTIFFKRKFEPNSLVYDGRFLHFTEKPFPLVGSLEPVSMNWSYSVIAYSKEGHTFIILQPKIHVRNEKGLITLTTFDFEGKTFYKPKGNIEIEVEKLTELDEVRNANKITIEATDGVHTWKKEFPLSSEIMKIELIVLEAKLR